MSERIIHRLERRQGPAPLRCHSYQPLYDRPNPTALWRPGKVVCQPIPGGFALVDTAWRGDGEIARVIHGESSRDPIDCKDRWYFIGAIAAHWNRELLPYADLHEHA